MKRYVKSASLALIACATSALAEPSYEDVVKMKYHFAEWGGTTKAEYSHCLKRVPLGSLVLPTNGMDIVVKHKNNRLLVFSKDKTLIDVRTSAQDSIAAAHNALIERFSLMASTRLMKPCQSIGDVCFVDTGEGWSSVVFARNNVEANVCSQTLLINAMDIAAQIDGKVLEASIPVGADALRKAAGATDRRGAADMDAGKGDGAGHRGKVPVLLDSQCAPGCTNHLLKPAQNLEMVAATNVAERAKKGCRFATATPEEDHAAAIRALGVTNIVVKNPGYFFYGGEYIPPPYTVTREGDFLKINGRYIRFFCKWPPPKLRKWHVTHKMPEVPTSVNEKTSEFDPAVRKYIDDCFDYWLTNHAGDESRWAAAMISDVLKLPCVKDAYVDEYGGLTVIWTGGQGKTCFDYSFMASNPSWWDPQPIDPNTFRIGGDNEAVGLAEQISDGNYLFWPLKNGGPWLSGSNLEPEFAKVLENIDKCATAKELSVACGWYPRRVELCADLLMHRDSFDAGLRKRISNRVVAIEAEKRAERERKEQEAAERRRRAAEAYERRTAAEGGEAMSQYQLGVCYAEGKGIAQDKAEAVKWWRKAAEQGVASAQYNLGMCYESGEGVAQDKAEAVKWYRKAAEQGHEKAKAALKKLE